MGANAWTADEEAWLAEVYPRHHNAEIARMHAERFPDRPRSDKAIGSRAKLLGLRKPEGFVRNPPRVWTPEVDEWFREFVPGHTEREISAECERVFGFPLREGQIGNHKTALGVKSGTHGGRFAKGQEPPNKGRPWSEWMSAEGAEASCRTQFRKGELNGIAAERDRGLLGVRIADGYRQIRVDPRGQRHTMDRWIPLAHYNWMQANGRDWPDGCKAIHIDRDPTNDDAGNIEPVPADLWPLVIGAVPGQLEWHDRETLRTAILYARVTRARTDAARRARIAAGRPRKGDMD